nr:Dihydroxyacetone kinase family protein [Streptococcus thermophilus]
MTTPTGVSVLDGARLLAWARSGAETLEEHREAINSLNVFPVPDSDTGSNMAYTMAAAVREAEDVDPSAGANAVAEALAFGSIKGARGNSGIVLSQVLRGVAQAALDGELDGRSVADALTNAVTFVERAINSPVEGTIITVLREAANAACATAETGELADVTAAALSAAEDALERTPSQLAELREAGVVDAGGTGLVLLLQVLHDSVTGEGGGDRLVGSATGPDPVHGNGHGTPGWLEVLFMFSGPLDDLESVLSHMGRSLVVARVTDTQGKVHIHTPEAGPVIEKAFAMGEVTDLRLEVLPDASPLHEARRVGRLIVAVTPPGSLMDLYTQAGAVAVAPGAGVMDDLRREIVASGAHEVLVLPNGQLDPETLDAVESAGQTEDTEIVLLPTVRLVNGIAALAVHDPRLPLDQAASLMKEAAEEMDVADIQAADSGVEVVNSNGPIAEAADLPTAIEEACVTLLAGGGELVTLLLAPDDAAVVNRDALEEKLGAEVLVYPADGLATLGHIGVE